MSHTVVATTGEMVKDCAFSVNDTSADRRDRVYGCGDCR